MRLQWCSGQCAKKHTLLCRFLSRATYMVISTRELERQPISISNWDSQQTTVGRGVCWVDSHGIHRRPNSFSHRTAIATKQTIHSPARDILHHVSFSVAQQFEKEKLDCPTRYELELAYKDERGGLGQRYYCTSNTRKGQSLSKHHLIIGKTSWS